MARVAQLNTYDVTNMSDLLVAVLDEMGVPAEKFGDTGMLTL
jgi:hypothetical protein